MGKSERVEGRWSLHTEGSPTGYWCSAAVDHLYQRGIRSGVWYYLICAEQGQDMAYFKALSENCEKRLLSSSCASVRPSTWTDFHEIWHLNSFLKYVEKYSSCILLRIRDVSDKTCRENQNTNFMFGNFFLKK